MAGTATPPVLRGRQQPGICLAGHRKPLAATVDLAGQMILRFTASSLVGDIMINLPGLPWRRLVPATVLALSGAAVLAVQAATAPPAGAAIPPGFSDTVVASITLPVALDVTPDGRMLVTTKPGQLFAVKGSTRTLALDARGVICAGQPGQDERGML